MLFRPIYGILIFVEPPHDESEQQAAGRPKDASQRAREKAAGLYFIAEGRTPRNKNQRQVLEKELVQARILTARGSTVYLLPEVIDPAHLGVKYPDAVVDGFVNWKNLFLGYKQPEIKKARPDGRTGYPGRPTAAKPPA